MANPIQATQAQGSIIIARLAGSLTVMNAPDLRVGLLETIKSYNPKVLAINLADVDFVDSSALGVFVEARRQMIQNNGCVTFTNVNKEIRGLMRIMNLEAVFNFVETESELTTPAGCDSDKSVSSVLRDPLARDDGPGRG